MIKLLCTILHVGNSVEDLASGYEQIGYQYEGVVSMLKNFHFASL